MDDDKDGPSTGSGRAEGCGEQALPRPLLHAEGEGLPAGGPQPLNPSARIHAGRNREIQVVRYPRRKLFDRARKDVFLEWFAATCNMGWSAEKAGVSYKTVSRHIRDDPDFRAEYEESMRAGVLRVKAISLATRRQEERIGIDGEIDAPELDDVDRDQAMRLVREHERTLHLGRKQGRMPKVAPNAEVRAALVKALATFGVRAAKALAAGQAPEE
jgi:hypothetical protein